MEYFGNIYIANIVNSKNKIIQELIDNIETEIKNKQCKYIKYCNKYSAKPRMILLLVNGETKDGTLLKALDELKQVCIKYDKEGLLDDIQIAYIDCLGNVISTRTINSMIMHVKNNYIILYN